MTRPRSRAIKTAPPKCKQLLRKGFICHYIVPLNRADKQPYKSRKQEHFIRGICTKFCDTIQFTTFINVVMERSDSRVISRIKGIMAFHLLNKLFIIQLWTVWPARRRVQIQMIERLNNTVYCVHIPYFQEEFASLSPQHNKQNPDFNVTFKSKVKSNQDTSSKHSCLSKDSCKYLFCNFLSFFFLNIWALFWLNVEPCCSQSL